MKKIIFILSILSSSLFSENTVLKLGLEAEKNSLVFIERMKEIDEITPEYKKKVSLEEAIVLFSIFSEISKYVNEEN
jgi:hypothetical protein